MEIGYFRWSSLTLKMVKICKKASLLDRFDHNFVRSSHFGLKNLHITLHNLHDQLRSIFWPNLPKSNRNPLTQLSHLLYSPFFVPNLEFSLDLQIFILVFQNFHQNSHSSWFFGFFKRFGRGNKILNYSLGILDVCDPLLGQQIWIHEFFTFFGLGVQNFIL